MQAQVQQLQLKVLKGNARVLELQRTADTLQDRVSAGEQAIQAAAEAAQVSLPPDIWHQRPVIGCCMVVQNRRVCDPYLNTGSIGAQTS